MNVFAECIATISALIFGRKFIVNAFKLNANFFGCFDFIVIT